MLTLIWSVLDLFGHGLVSILVNIRGVLGSIPSTAGFRMSATRSSALNHLNQGESSMSSGTPRPRSVKSLKPRFCIHCGHNGRGLLAAPHGGWIHRNVCA